ncbi:uncharacterized protein LOC113377919 [Ctenocephalides felis]|uniref:uncharacterized protein LOC113377266 n=1 Tax=Ctenocephalides felis TaxID=7515 RepID=UPI000E6E2376|nr:uncharacterized protein LOC113377266 [Ctenocephalides felis]XP_026474160.1 uncharacterized protein LOC113377919 [Ctenocephalides felis]
MVGSNGTMMAIRVVRSKLRKREEHSNSVHPEAPQTITAVVPPAEPVAYRQQPIWVFPPNPPQPFLYSSNQDTLSQNLSRSGSFRKNLGGRWKRFVKGKPQQDSHAIPPELKPQLKQIFVY